MVHQKPSAAFVSNPRSRSPPPRWRNPRSRFRRLQSSPVFPFLCLALGVALGALVVRSPGSPAAPCRQLEPKSVVVAWEGGNGGDGGGAGLGERHKVMGFVGIQTGFGSVGRRRSLRKTWMPSDHEGLRRLEDSTGLTLRFVIGRTSDKSKMADLRKEVEEYDDFILLDIEEEYSRLPYKTLAFFRAAYRLYDADFYVKADDDIYLRPDRLSLLIAKERPRTQTYLGCMKKGPLFTNPKLKWMGWLLLSSSQPVNFTCRMCCQSFKNLQYTYLPNMLQVIGSDPTNLILFVSCIIIFRYEPLSYILGSEYFLHAYGPIYALSAEVVASIIALKNDSLRMFSNEDVTIGAWMLAMNVNHENNKDLCSRDCTQTSIAVWDIPTCSGLCKPEEKLIELHQKEICSGNPSSTSNE